MFFFFLSKYLSNFFFSRTFNVSLPPSPWFAVFICLCPTKKNYLSNVLPWWLSLAVREYFSIQRAREGKNKDRVAEATFRFGASRETTTEQLNNSTMGNQTD